MDIKRITEDNQTILYVTGRIDASTSPAFDSEISFFDSSTNLVVDFSKTEYISSAGLRSLLKAQKMLLKNGSLKIINVSESVMEVFKITGFDNILTVK